MASKKIGILGKLLLLSKEYDKQKLKHIKAGPVKKIFQLLLLLGFAALGIYLTYLAFGLFIISSKMSFEIIARIIGGALLLIIAAVLLYSTIGYMFMFVLLFFRCKQPKVEKTKENVANAEQPVEGENAEQQNAEQPVETDKPAIVTDKKYSRTSRAFDITFGCIYLVLAFGFIACAVGAVLLGFKNNPFNIS